MDSSDGRMLRQCSYVTTPVFSQTHAPGVESIAAPVKVLTASRKKGSQIKQLTLDLRTIKKGVRKKSVYSLPRVVSLREWAVEV